MRGVVGEHVRCSDGLAMLLSLTQSIATTGTAHYWLLSPSIAAAYR